MIGIDLENINRFDDDKILRKIALEGEIAYINRFKNRQEKIASLWTVKEACFKALDVSAGEISYKEIELCHKDNGAPYLILHGKAKECFEKLGGEKIELSISHTKDTVCAVVWIK